MRRLNSKSVSEGITKIASANSTNLRDLISAIDFEPIDFFRGANLSGKDLSSLDLRGLNFDNADLRGANLDNTNYDIGAFNNAIVTDDNIDRDDHLISFNLLADFETNFFPYFVMTWNIRKGEVDRLKKILGITFRGLSVKFGISESTLRKARNGHSVSGYTIKKIATGIGSLAETKNIPVDLFYQPSIRALFRDQIIGPKTIAEYRYAHLQDDAFQEELEHNPSLIKAFPSWPLSRFYARLYGYSELLEVYSTEVEDGS